MPIGVEPPRRTTDYAYSSTVHAAQGLTCDRVIAVLDTDCGAPTDQAMFYVELTCARDNVVLLTDDREALETSPAEELSALRAIGEQFEAPEEIVQQHPPPPCKRSLAARCPATSSYPLPRPGPPGLRSPARPWRPTARPAG